MLGKQANFHLATDDRTFWTNKDSPFLNMIELNGEFLASYNNKFEHNNKTMKRLDNI